MIFREIVIFRDIVIFREINVFSSFFSDWYTRTAQEKTKTGLFQAAFDGLGQNRRWVFREFSVKIREIGFQWNFRQINFLEKFSEINIFFSLFSWNSVIFSWNWILREFSVKLSFHEFFQHFLIFSRLLQNGPKGKSPYEVSFTKVSYFYVFWFHFTNFFREIHVFFTNFRQDATGETSGLVNLEGAVTKGKGQTAQSMSREARR